MAEYSKIEWCDHTWNHVHGCARVSPGCDHCYAERMSRRNPKTLGVWGPSSSGGTRVLAADAKWREPLRWNDRVRRDGTRPELVFTASIADVFEDFDDPLRDAQGRPLWRDPSSVRFAFHERCAGQVRYTMQDARDRLWCLIRETPNLRWLLLTKRPENIGRMMPHGAWPNVWLGCTCETDEYRWRVDALADAPQDVPVRFVSAEPLLGPLNLWDHLKGIQWLIVGGESGAASRPMHCSWVRALLAQCREEDVPCFVKQMGRTAVETDYEIPHGRHRRYPLDLEHDRGHGGDLRDWPADLRCRAFPHCHRRAS